MEHNNLRFELQWAIIREVDRINRQSQVSVSLAKRIRKLKGFADYLIADSQNPFKANDKDDVAKAFYEKWEELEKDDRRASNNRLRREVEWEQYGLLMLLFKHYNLFSEMTVPFEHIGTLELD